MQIGGRALTKKRCPERVYKTDCRCEHVVMHMCIWHCNDVRMMYSVMILVVIFDIFTILMFRWQVVTRIKHLHDRNPCQIDITVSVCELYSHLHSSFCSPNLICVVVSAGEYFCEDRRVFKIGYMYGTGYCHQGLSRGSWTCVRSKQGTTDVIPYVKLLQVLAI